MMKRMRFLIALILMIPIAIFSNDSLISSDEAARMESRGMMQLQRTSRAFNRVAEKTRPGVVHISTIKTVRQQYIDPFFDVFGGGSMGRRHGVGQGRERQQKGLGSGVIVSKNGYILTNNHVIENVDEISVKLSDGRTFSAEIIGTDPGSDVALLKIEAEDLPMIELGDSEKIKVGDWAIAIGSPFGLQGTMTVGIISAKGRSEVDIVDYSDLIQTDASINPGNSGGALLNIEGKLVGLNTAIFTKSGGDMGIGFAIPVNMAKKVMDDLLREGEVVRGWVGVYIQPISEELKETLNLNTQNGALIADVIENSPAEKGGLKRGDIVTHINGRVVTNYRTLISKVSATQVGRDVTLTVKRKRKGKGYNTKDIVITIQTRPEEEPSLAESRKEKIGFSVKPYTAKAPFEQRLPVDRIQIHELVPESSAVRAGLKPGDIILEINYEPVATVEAFDQIVDGLPDDEDVLLLIKRGRFSQFVVLKMDS